MVATGNRKPTKPLNPRQDVFARLVVSGKTQSDAWREAYGHPKATDKTAKEAGSKLAAKPVVAARIKEFQARSAHKAILSLGDRLAIMAEGAQSTKATWGERARCVEVYNKTAGDHAPERQEVTVKGDPNAPVVVASRSLTKAEKIAALAAQRRTKETTE